MGKKRIWNDESVKRLISENQSLGNDPIEIIREKARELIFKAYSLGWSGPPYDVFKIADLLGIEIAPNQMVIDARLVPTGEETYRLEYNPFQSENRINFTIAHEIGHTLFPDCDTKVRNREDKENMIAWELEFLCNVAASEILLPYAEFSEDVNKRLPKIESLIDLSNEYKASLESVFLRYAEVTNVPCVICIATYNYKDELVIEYSKKSRNSNLSLKEGSKIPNESVIYDCIRSGWTSYGTEQWNEFGETRYSLSCIGLTPTRNTVKPRIGVLIVPEFYSNTNEAEIYEVNGDAVEPRGSSNDIRIIAQIVNTQAGLGSGFGKAMSKKYPLSRKAILEWKKNKDEFILGNSKLTEIGENLYVFQMIAQKGIFPKYGEIPLQYKSLNENLKKLSNLAIKMNASVHMPPIGTGMAKGDWKIIKEMIMEEIVNKGIDVTVYRYPGSKIPNRRNQQNLSLFPEEFA